MSKFIIAASLVGSALLSTVAITPASAQTIPHWQWDCYRRIDPLTKIRSGQSRFASALGIAEWTPNSRAS